MKRFKSAAKFQRFDGDLLLGCGCCDERDLSGQLFMCCIEQRAVKRIGKDTYVR